MLLVKLLILVVALILIGIVIKNSLELIPKVLIILVALYMLKIVLML